MKEKLFFALKVTGSVIGSGLIIFFIGAFIWALVGPNAITGKLLDAHSVSPKDQLTLFYPAKIESCSCVPYIITGPNPDTIIVGLLTPKPLSSTCGEDYYQSVPVEGPAGDYAVIKGDAVQIRFTSLHDNKIIYTNKSDYPVMLIFIMIGIFCLIWLNLKIWDIQ